MCHVVPSHQSSAEPISQYPCQYVLFAIPSMCPVSFQFASSFVYELRRYRLLSPITFPAFPVGLGSVSMRVFSAEASFTFT